MVADFKQPDFKQPPRVARTKVQIDDLCAWFADALVLKHVSLPIEEGRVTAIIGPSGCGKSTFVRCLNRLHELTPQARVSGRVRLDDKNLYGPDADPVSVRRHIGMVFQKPNPFPSMSIRDNVLSGLRLSGVRFSDGDELVERMLRLVGLWEETKDTLAKPGGRLSSGQQQRLCIARSLALQPEVLLMDEPCSSLDPIATARVEETIHDLAERYTIVIVTHNMQQAARVSHHTAFFYLGELVEHDTTDSIFTNPHDQRTEDYITGRFG